MHSENILEINGVSKSFPGVKALDHVSIAIRKGVVHGIVGENGAGKSTLMKILSGVYRADRTEGSSIWFDGKQMEISSPIQSMQLGLSIIYQEFNLVDSMSVGENIFLGRFREAGGMQALHRKARSALDRIGCDIDTRAMVGDLSISQKQMVEIAKAISLNSKLIIMDEPSTTLTNDEMENLIRLINELRADGITIIYISHKLEEIFALCDQVTVIRDGSVIGTRDIEDITREEMVSMMVGRSIESEFPPRPQTAGDVLLAVHHLHTNKLHDVSFQVKAGEILGLVGLVGAGRTEIVRALFGADAKQSGEIRIHGEAVTIRNPVDAKKAGIGFVTEDRKQQGLFMRFSVADNIVVATMNKLAKRGFVSKRREEEIAQGYVESLGIKTPKLSTKVMSLSGGNQQKCIIGRWLEMEPRVLILDEPTRGIDVGAKYEIYLLMKEIASKGNAIILISSELPEVLNLSNRCLTISAGRVVGEFDPAVDSAERIMQSILT
ncbi:sugar ABC transporter ATP-binding protein [Butyricicoccus faecihominis]|uniref:sugar ABC transporter ATP-binding protein n=1 Tax=Butyricicoccaceae TaxID=3085642 RepID=UPI00247AE02E|nr:sugar ABC transporter ATP-binding protein [Agathobaculum sp. NTUH-O15-33]MCQ5128875.1 sugar ABC transporter ATP-binding protein [Butyricicoccus faecihominis]WNX85514.1 sugar ABC transporter ATP-binding protein [Agathobaculum sp. NTUH-O15-33]